MAIPILKKVCDESGLLTLVSSPRDAHLVIVQRSLRLLVYGQSALVLTAFLKSLAFTEIQMGIFMTLTLLGDAAGSLVLTLYADRVGRARILIVGSCLMVFSGVVFALSEIYVVLLVAAMVGVITPSGGEIGPFRAIEESILAQLVDPEERSTIFAWYLAVSGLALALGNLSGGWITQVLQDHFGWMPISAYRFMFWMYAVAGVVGTLLSMGLSKGVEVREVLNGEGEEEEGLLQGEEEEEVVGEEQVLVIEEQIVGAEGIVGEDQVMGAEQIVEEEQIVGEVAGEDQIAEEEQVAGEDQIMGEEDYVWGEEVAELVGGEEEVTREEAVKDNILRLSPETQKKVWLLSWLFGVDNLASGLVPVTIIIYFFTEKFHVSEGTLGNTFFITSFVSAISYIVSGSLARRIGNIQTMAFTHIPSAILLALIPFPSNFQFARAILITVFCTTKMDVAPRTAFLASYVHADERTSVMGIINIVRILSQSIGPTVTGWLASHGLIWLSFVLAGVFQASYDFAMVYFFIRVAAVS